MEPAPEKSGRIPEIQLDPAIAEFSPFHVPPVARRFRELGVRGRVGPLAHGL
jgi:hypothetical protein